MTITADEGGIGVTTDGDLDLSDGLSGDLSDGLSVDVDGGDLGASLDAGASGDGPHVEASGNAGDADVTVSNDDPLQDTIDEVLGAVDEILPLGPAEDAPPDDGGLLGGLFGGG